MILFTFGTVGAVDVPLVTASGLEDEFRTTVQKCTQNRSLHKYMFMYFLRERRNDQKPRRDVKYFANSSV